MENTVFLKKSNHSLSHQNFASVKLKPCKIKKNDPLQNSELG